MRWNTVVEEHKILTELNSQEDPLTEPSAYLDKQSKQEKPVRLPEIRPYPSSGHISNYTTTLIPIACQPSEERCDK